jgi:hypothetical protein
MIEFNVPVAYEDTRTVEQIRSAAYALAEEAIDAAAQAIPELCLGSMIAQVLP